MEEFLARLAGFAARLYRASTTSLRVERQAGRGCWALALLEELVRSGPRADTAWLPDTLAQLDTDYLLRLAPDYAVDDLALRRSSAQSSSRCVTRPPELPTSRRQHRLTVPR